MNPCLASVLSEFARQHLSCAVKIEDQPEKFHLQGIGRLYLQDVHTDPDHNTRVAIIGPRPNRGGAAKKLDLGWNSFFLVRDDVRRRDQEKKILAELLLALKSTPGGNLTFRCSGYEITVGKNGHPAKTATASAHNPYPSKKAVSPKPIGRNLNLRVPRDDKKPVAMAMWPGLPRNG